MLWMIQPAPESQLEWYVQFGVPAERITFLGTQLSHTAARLEESLKDSDASQMSKLRKQAISCWRTASNRGDATATWLLIDASVARKDLGVLIPRAIAQTRALISRKEPLGNLLQPVIANALFIMDEQIFVEGSQTKKRKMRPIFMSRLAASALMTFLMFLARIMKKLLIFLYDSIKNTLITILLNKLNQRIK